MKIHKMMGFKVFLLSMYTYVYKNYFIQIPREKVLYSVCKLKKKKKKKFICFYIILL